MGKEPKNHDNIDDGLQRQLLKTCFVDRLRVVPQPVPKVDSLELVEVGDGRVKYLLSVLGTTVDQG
jgi:hypothetical protein